MLLPEDFVRCPVCGGTEFEVRHLVVLPRKRPSAEQLDMMLRSGVSPYLEERLQYICANPACRKELSW